MSKLVKISNLKKTLRYLKKNGIRPTYYAMRERMEMGGYADDYVYEAPSEEILKEQEKRAMDMNIKFSILVPAFETKEEYLRAMIDSVLTQTYGNFELIISDASSSEQVKKIIETYTDERIKYRYRGQNAGISANTSQALVYATGDYAGLLDHDDVLTRDALYEMASCIESYKKEGVSLQLLYSDEDKCDSLMEHCYEPNRKPDFNLDLLLSNNYICHFLVMQRQLMQELGFRSVCDGAQDYDIVMRAVNVMMGKDKQQTKKPSLPIAHIPKVLYHWRCHESSTAENPASKQYAYDAGKRVVEDFLRARSWKGTVSHLRHLGFYRTDYQPDLLPNREDVAVVGGKLIDRHNKIAGGIYTADGTPLYKGLHREYSGYMHRASLQQEVEAVDIRCMKVSQGAEFILEEMTGQPYHPHPGTGRFDWKECFQRGQMWDEEQILDLSCKFCERIREMGYRIVWDPLMTEKLDK